MLHLASKDGEYGFIGDSDASKYIYPVFRLSSDLKALEYFIEGG